MVSFLCFQLTTKLLKILLEETHLVSDLRSDRDVTIILEHKEFELYLFWTSFSQFIHKFPSLENSSQKMESNSDPFLQLSRKGWSTLGSLRAQWSGHLIPMSSDDICAQDH